jgi:CRISPR-associated endonuclease/helicase Cas3
VSNPDNPYLDEYAYVMPINERDEIDNLTEGLSRLRELDLINHMAKKHGNIYPTHPVKGIPESKISLRSKVIEGFAKDPEFPIYTSYTSDDLIRVGGESARHSYAVYYAVCDKQPIGAISIKQLTTNED